jgi:hypothetical protein
MPVCAVRNVMPSLLVRYLDYGLDDEIFSIESKEKMFVSLNLMRRQKRKAIRLSHHILYERIY